MIQAKTYTVGDGGSVRRLDDLTGSWIDVSISNTVPPTAGIGLFDVETDPVNGSKVFIVGEGNFQQNIFGIYYSVDAGANWIVPGGNYNTAYDPTGLFRWNEVYVLDSSNIFVCGSGPSAGWVAISNDGGATFNLATQLPPLPTAPILPPVIPDIFSIHFITPLIGVVGTTACAVKTIDGGATWIPLNGGNVIGPSPYAFTLNANGIHMSQNQQVINFLTSTGIFLSIDGGNTWTLSYTWLIRNGIHLTWINDNELWGFGGGGERVKTINGGTTWTVLNAYSPGAPNHRAGHFYLNQNGFYSANSDILATTNGAASGILSETAPYGITAVWTWYSESQCFLLESCDGSVPPILVSNDLSGSVGQIIEVCPDDLPPAGGNGQGQGQPVIPFPNDECITLYNLFDCCGLQAPLTVTNNLGAYQNNILVIPSISLTTCWEVRKYETAATNIGCVNLTGATYFINCTLCTEANPCTPIPVLDECTCFTITEPPVQKRCCWDVPIVPNGAQVELHIVINGTDYTVTPPVLAYLNGLGLGTFTLNASPSGDQYVLICVDGIEDYGDIIFIGPFWPPTGLHFPPTCTITGSNCDGAVTLLNIGTIFPTCEQCIQECYLLIDCLNVNNFIITDEDFSQYVGQTVHLKDCPDICWQVNVSATCDTPVCVSEVIEAFPSCAECLPPPPPPLPLELHPRRVKPGYYTPGCSPEYTEKVNCNFGEQMYNEMLRNRYGLTVCCEGDLDKWAIKKELLDLKAIYDPSLCKCFLGQCCPPTCVDAVIEVFNPIPCPAPTDVTGIITVEVPPCPPPGQINFTRIILDPVVPCVCYVVDVPPGTVCGVEYTNCAGVVTSQLVIGGVPTYICGLTTPTPPFNCPGFTVASTPFGCLNGECQVN